MEIMSWAHVTLVGPNREPRLHHVRMVWDELHAGRANQPLLGLVKKVIPKPNKEQLTKALLDAQNNCFAVGLTTVDDAGLDKQEVELIDKLHKEGKLNMKVYAMLTDNEENLNHYLKNGPYKTTMLNVRSFKFYGDGALGSRGACLLKPYSDVNDSIHYGFLLNEETYYRESAQKIYDAGFQMNTHCIGDSANRLFLNIYGSILPEGNDNRWRIEHCTCFIIN